MNPTPTPAPAVKDSSGGHSRTARRLRFGALTLVILVAVIASATILNVLASRLNRRFDVTATGEHQLAPRSLALLGALNEPHEVIIAADVSSLPARARQDARDVLDRFVASGQGRFTFRVIDFATQAGRTEYADLLRSLSTQDAAGIAAGREAVESGARKAAAIANDLAREIAPGLSQLAGSFTASSAEATRLLGRLEASAGECSLIARDLAAAVSGTTALLEQTIEGVSLPASEEAATRLLAPLSQAARMLVMTEATLRDLARVQPAAAATANRAADALRERRETCDAASDQLQRLPRTDARLVADAIARSATVLVRGPRREGSTMPSVRALPFEQIFPNQATLESTGLASADLRRRAEDLIAAALGVLRDPNPPIVVLAHAEPALSDKRVQLFQALTDRLVRGGIDVVEWNLLASSEPPALTRLDPSDSRPKVFLFRGPDTTQAAGASGEPSGLDRHRQVAAAAALIVSQGHGVLLSIGPSIVPVSTQPDAMDAALSPFGLAVRSDRVLLSEVRQGSQRQVLTDTFPTVTESTNPIAPSIRGLPVLMPWPVAFTTSAQAAVILEVPSRPETWGESSWMGYRLVPRAQRAFVQDAPKFDEGRDDRHGPWPVAVAAERTLDSGATQRLVAVGSNDWLIDPVTTMSQGNVDGRATLTAPGNLELVESSVRWLARQDGLIGATASARGVPLVVPIADGTLTLLWWTLVAGMPLGILLLGVLVRWLRG